MSLRPRRPRRSARSVLDRRRRRWRSNLQISTPRNAGRLNQRARHLVDLWPAWSALRVGQAAPGEVTGPTDKHRWRNDPPRATNQETERGAEREVREAKEHPQILADGAEPCSQRRNRSIETLHARSTPTRPAKHDPATTARPAPRAGHISLASHGRPRWSRPGAIDPPGRDTPHACAAREAHGVATRHTPRHTSERGGESNDAAALLRVQSCYLGP
jgi:hypothetical protein